ncbi:hypothetical protein [Desulfotomaculum nigrificans]|uniref:hypothetical protein n=1 Tax=Desulfotomaculum nigrificans TaxID=1565 RepID=UPI0003076784|nr:hypothetical protein [Desulfotomaculum nigrificans]
MPPAGVAFAAPVSWGAAAEIEQLLLLGAVAPKGTGSGAVARPGMGGSCRLNKGLHQS